MEMMRCCEVAAFVCTQSNYSIFRADLHAESFGVLVFRAAIHQFVRICAGAAVPVAGSECWAR